MSQALPIRHAVQGDAAVIVQILARGGAVRPIILVSKGTSTSTLSLAVWGPFPQPQLHEYWLIPLAWCKCKARKKWSDIAPTFRMQNIMNNRRMLAVFFSQIYLTKDL